MNKTRTTIVCLTLLMLAIQGYARVQVASGLGVKAKPAVVRPLGVLDDQCTIHYSHYTYGSYTGSMTWPEGSGAALLTGICFTNSCTPGQELCTYCVDLAHFLFYDPYC